MKTVVVLIEKLFVCPVAVSIPDWWDDTIARQRLSTPESLGMLEDMADPCGWEESNEEPAIRAVGAPGGPVTACLEFGADAKPDARATGLAGMSVASLLYEVFTARFYRPRDGEQAECQTLVDAGLAVPCAQGKLDGYRVSAAGYRAVMARWGHG